MTKGAGRKLAEEVRKEQERYEAAVAAKKAREEAAKQGGGQ